jgi:hypothetical protein
VSDCGFTFAGGESEVPDQHRVSGALLGNQIEPLSVLASGSRGIDWVHHLSCYAEAVVSQDFDAGEKSVGPLSSELDDPGAVPYFLWDEPMTVAELRYRLLHASDPERTRLLAKILREARDTEVWSFTTPESVARDWKALSLHLGRRRAFWEFLLTSWATQGRLSLDWAR